MKILILAAIAALGACSTIIAADDGVERALNLGFAGAQSLSYNAPAHNYYQNNWMTGRG